MPDHSTVVGVLGRVVRKRGVSLSGDDAVLEHGRLPDPESDAIEELTRRVDELEAQIRTLTGHPAA